MLSPGELGTKSTAQTAAMVAGNPWLAFGNAALQAVGGGPSAAYGAPVYSGGNPINMAPVNIGGGSASGQNEQGVSSNPYFPNPLNPLDFGSPVGVAGYGPPIPQTGNSYAPFQTGAQSGGVDIVPLAALAAGAFLLVRNFA